MGHRKARARVGSAVILASKHHHVECTETNADRRSTSMGCQQRAPTALLGARTRESADLPDEEGMQADPEHEEGGTEPERARADVRQPAWRIAIAQDEEGLCGPEVRAPVLVDAAEREDEGWKLLEAADDKERAVAIRCLNEPVAEEEVGDVVDPGGQDVQ
eukprot:3577708-Rhodomonas_salina.1